MKTAVLVLVLMGFVATSVQFVLRPEFEDDALINVEEYLRKTRNADSSESSEEKEEKSVIEGSGEEESKQVFKREAAFEVEASGEEPSTVETRFKRDIEGSGEEVVATRFRREAESSSESVEASGEEPTFF